MAVAVEEERSELERLIEELRPLREYRTEAQLEFFARCELERRIRDICAESGHPNAYEVSGYHPNRLTMFMHCPDCNTSYYRGITKEDVENYWARD